MSNKCCFIYLMSEFSLYFELYLLFYTSTTHFICSCENRYSINIHNKNTIRIHNLNTIHIHN